MSFLLKISRLIDAINTLIGKSLMWLVLAATLISAGNAIVRKSLNISSNAFLEIQWYLFAAVFLLGGGYAFLRNVHVRVDFISARLSARTRNWIDVVGIVVFMLPLCYMMIKLGWPSFYQAWVTGEMSSNSGGLIRWPAFGLIPLGFFLLFLQGLSELFKRLNFLFSDGPDVLAPAGPSEEELLAQELLREEEERAKEEQRAQGAN